MDSQRSSGARIRSLRPSALVAATRPLWIVFLVLSIAGQFAVYLHHIKAAFERNDFRLYYAGAQVGLRYGWSRIYDPALEQQAVAALHPAGPWYALLTPAPITWIVAPLTAIGYPAAYWVWMAACGALLAAAVWYARPRQWQPLVWFAWWLTLGPLWFSLYEGQVTLLAAAALLLAGRLLQQRRDALGGAVLAVALLKPHLVLLVPVALLVAGRNRALLGFCAAAGAGSAATLLALHPDGVRDYLTMITAPQPYGDAAETLRAALGGGTPVLVIQAGAVAAVLGIALVGRRTRAFWPALVAGVLGSYVLAPYWHPQDFLVVDAAIAILITAAAVDWAVVVAVAAAVVANPTSPLTNRMPSFQMTVAWLVLTLTLLVSLAVHSSLRARVDRPSPPPGLQPALSTS